MKREDICLTDIKRILFGEAPEVFLIEVFIRSVISYIVLLVILRLMGKRMSGKLTHTEAAVMLMFGAIVSSAMQIPDRGVLESCFVLLLVLILQRVTTLWALKSRAVENALLGKMQMLSRDGVLELSSMNTENISKRQLFSYLRSKNIRHLGEVKRMYMETTGSFSIYKSTGNQVGLSLSPYSDKGVRDIENLYNDQVACGNCGAVYAKNEQPTACTRCEEMDWQPAII